MDHPGGWTQGWERISYDVYDRGPTFERRGVGDWARTSTKEKKGKAWRGRFAGMNA